MEAPPEAPAYVALLATENDGKRDALDGVEQMLDSRQSGGAATRWC